MCFGVALEALRRNGWGSWAVHFILAGYVCDDGPVAVISFFQALGFGSADNDPQHRIGSKVKRVRGSDYTLFMRNCSIRSATTTVACVWTATEGPASSELLLVLRLSMAKVHNTHLKDNALLPSSWSVALVDALTTDVYPRDPSLWLLLERRP